jgi:enediyne biosynthesis protein E4
MSPAGSPLFRRRPVRITVVLGLAILVGLAAYRFTRSPLTPGVPANPRSDEVSSGDAYSSPPWFRDITAETGILFTYRNGEEADQFTILESLGGGVGLFDYDGDGLLDIFLTGGGLFEGPAKNQLAGRPCRLCKNLGNWKFQDVTEAAGLDGPWWYTHGVAVADYDRDGWPDLFVTGYGRQALYHNQSDGKNGRRFIDVTEKLGLRDAGWTTGAGWADLDGDGFPELYVCRYADWSFANNPACPGQRPDVPRDICPTSRFQPLVHALYKNRNGLRFINTAGEQGFTPGYGLGVVLVDVNGDGRPDIYVGNDMTRNFLFLNRGGALEETGIKSGVALPDSGKPTASMGIDAADYDSSGRPSIFISNFQSELPSLFRNVGQGTFVYQSWAAGLAALDRNHVGWGTGFLDADNDGWPDIVVANGHVFRHPPGTTVKQRPMFLLNVELKEQRAFRDGGGRGGTYFQTPIVGRGLAIGDLDNDGWPDLVVSHINSPVAILRNQAAGITPNRWIGFKLTGKQNRDIVGSSVTVETENGKFTQFVKGGGSYLSARDPRLLFGLGAAERVTRVTVRWSWGETRSWETPALGLYHELREGGPL